MPLWAVIGVGWTLLALVVGLLVGQFIRYRDRKPPHVEPGPQRRKHPQVWPLRRGHQK